MPMLQVRDDPATPVALPELSSDGSGVVMTALLWFSSSGQLLFALQCALSAATLLLALALLLIWANPRCFLHFQLFQLARAQFLKPFREVVDEEGRVVVVPRYTNQLGNNLFQYSYARLRALHSGARFQSGALNQEVFTAESGDCNPFAKAAPFDRIETAADYSPPKRGAAWESDGDAAASRDFLSARPNAFAQDIALYSGDGGADLARMRSWLEPSVESHVAERARALALGVQDADMLLMHLRFAGVQEGLLMADPTYHELPAAYYVAAIEEHNRRQARAGNAGVPARRVMLVHGPKCDAAVAALRDQLRARFPGLAFSCESTGRAADFALMYYAKNLVLSVSTFSWWAGFLGGRAHAKTVYYPVHAQPRTLLTLAHLRRWFNRLLPAAELAARRSSVAAAAPASPPAGGGEGGGGRRYVEVPYTTEQSGLLAGAGEGKEGLGPVGKGEGGGALAKGQRQLAVGDSSIRRQQQQQQRRRQPARAGLVRSILNPTAHWMYVLRLVAVAAVAVVR